MSIYILNILLLRDLLVLQSSKCCIYIYNTIDLKDYIFNILSIDLIKTFNNKLIIKISTSNNLSYLISLNINDENSIEFEVLNKIGIIFKILIPSHNLILL